MKQLKNPYKQDWGTRDRTKGKYHNPGTGLVPHSGLSKSYDRKNKRDVWTITNKPYKGAHFAVFPPDLIEPCILAGIRREILFSIHLWDQELQVWLQRNMVVIILDVSCMRTMPVYKLIV